jgi:hypothetical protein
VARMEDRRCLQGFRWEARRHETTGKTYTRWEDNIKMDLSDSSVDIALGYRLDDRGSTVRLPAGAGNFSLRHRFKNGSGAQPASYPMGARGSYPGVKWPGREADHSPPSSAEVKE